MEITGDLVGDIRMTGLKEDQADFLHKLKELMVIYRVDKVDVGWARPGPCVRCGDPGESAPKEPESVFEELPDGDPRLEGELKPGLDKSEALDLLDGVVDKMPGHDIEMDIPHKKDKER